MLECKVHGAMDLRVVDAPVPQAAEGEVLVRLGAAGICGSDMHYYLHGRVGSFVIREPLVPGHEASGVVAAIGPRAKIGDRVAINPSRPCGRCPATIGCMQVIACRMAGAARIVVTDIVDHPLSVARQVGADEAIRIDRMPDGEPLSPATGEFDVAFEVSSAPQALATCLQAVRRGGIVMQVGTLPAGASTCAR